MTAQNKQDKARDVNDGDKPWGQKNPLPPRAANDTLYHELEHRYGGGFAQWVLDGLKTYIKDGA